MFNQTKIPVVHLSITECKELLSEICVFYTVSLNEKHKGNLKKIGISAAKTRKLHKNVLLLLNNVEEQAERFKLSR